MRSLRQSAADRSLRLARLCYDHVAGALGVTLLDRMLGYGWLISGAGLDFEVIGPGSRALAGALGAALTRALVDRQWLRRTSTAAACN